MKTKTTIFIAFLFLAFSNGFAQNENPFIRKGNKLYNEGKFSESEIEYRKALGKNQKSAKGTYNLGSSLYRQENFEESARHFMDASQKLSPKDAAGKSAALHNLGNSLLKSGKLQESIEAYKQALRLNPNDEDTRYNLAFAMKQLQQQQQQQQNQDNKDKNEDKNKEQEQKQNNPQNQDQQQKEQPREKPQISKQDAERMLEALKNDEQKTLDKVKQQKMKATPVQVEKDW